MASFASSFLIVVSSVAAAPVKTPGRPARKRISNKGIKARHCIVCDPRAYLAASSQLIDRAMASSSPTQAPGSGGEEEFTEVVVVRHGETACNASKIVQGQLDPELNDKGREQAKKVARRLSKQARKPAAVYSSDLRRAAGTAEIIARAWGVSTLVLTQELREMRMGYLQGLTRAEARARNHFGGYDIYQISTGGDAESREQEIPGGGESLNQLNQRLVSYVNMIARQHVGERVVVVSHEVSIMELCRHTDKADNYISREIPNVSLNVFRISGLTGKWILEGYGDIDHLKEDVVPEDPSGGDGAST